MSLAYQDARVELLAADDPGAIEERRRHIFGTYIERMFERRGQENQPYSPA
jgi:hypothetical protein